MRDIWFDIWFEITYRGEKILNKIKKILPKLKLRLIKKIIDSIIFYSIPILLIIILVQAPTKNVDILYDLTREPVEISQENIGKALNESIVEECNKHNVDVNLVYAIIQSNILPDDGVPRYGIMHIHPDLLKKYEGRFKVSVVESSYSNVVVGIERLEWSLSANKSLEGALMVYYYTNPVAQKMWKMGIKTTQWTELVKENYYNGI